MINPYFTYVLTFLLSLLFFLLGWSSLYPPLQGWLLLFLALSFVPALTLGYRFYKKNSPAPAIPEVPALRHLAGITAFIYVLWLIEFVYAGGIPLIKILLNQPFDYRSFGVPSLHVFVVTFSSWFSTWLFHLYLSQRNKKILLLYLINMAAALLIFNRGMLLFNISSSLFVLLLMQPRLQLSQLLRLLPGIALILMLFGILGNFRLAHGLNQPYNRDIVLSEVGMAKASFINSYIPKEFFWTYLYASSPLANLQYNIQQQTAAPVSAGRVLAFVNNEWLPDFLSKRLNRLAGFEKLQPAQVAPSLITSTVYTRSFCYLSWWGLAAMAVFIMLYARLYMALLGKNHAFYLSGMATLNTVYFFLMFDNMFAFSGLSFQLLYPLLGRWLGKHLFLAPKV